MSTRPAPQEIIGYLRDGVTPVRVVAGGSEDDDSGTGLDLENPDDGAGEEPDDEPEDGAEDAPDDEPKVPKSDIDKLKAAQAKRNSEHATEMRKLRAQLKAATATASKSDDGKDEAAAKAVEEATAAAERRFKPIAIRSAAKAGFLEAGLTDLSDSRMSKLLRMLNTDDIDVEDDGTVVGLDDQIEQVKEDFPEFFAKPEPAAPAPKRVPRGDAADRKNEPPAPRTTGDKIAAQVLSGRPRS